MSIEPLLIYKGIGLPRGVVLSLLHMTKTCWRSSMVEQLICNQQVAGSIPIASSIELLSEMFFEDFGEVPERSKGTDCKSVGFGLRRFKSFPLHQKNSGEMFWCF